jgi:choline dehydrogenase-like flavoprotein
METHYLIVGAGSAGCVLAGRLSEDPTVQVTLLEAGPPDTSALIHCPAGLALMARKGNLSWAYETVPQAGLLGRRGYQPRGKVLGGSSSINAMIYIRGQAQDYDDWAAQGNPGWGWADVLPWFIRSEHNERGPSPWHGTGGPVHVKDLDCPSTFRRAFVQAAVQAGLNENPDFNGETQEGAGPYQVFHKAGERHSAAKAYLTPHLDRPNLKVITGVHVTRILFEGHRAVGASFMPTEGGATQSVRAHREVLLCAGAFGSPQLLMLSGVGDGAALQAQGIALVADRPGVGRNLHDHPDVVQVVNVPGSGYGELFGLSLPGLWRAWRGTREWRAHRTGIMTTNFGEAGAFLRSDPALERPDLQLHFVVGKLQDHGRKPSTGHGFSCHVCVLRPRSRGSVTLASPDSQIAPRIDPNFLSDPADIQALVRGFRQMRGLLSQPALARYGGRELPESAAAQTDDDIEHYIRLHADTIYHPVGTCRMGQDDQAVVDARLRVHGVSGLRVVDASIFPTIPSGNTNAPTLMVAERAADMIRHDALH